MQEFLAYCFHSRANESNHLFRADKLFLNIWWTLGPFVSGTQLYQDKSGEFAD